MRHFPQQGILYLAHRVNSQFSEAPFRFFVVLHKKRCSPAARSGLPTAPDPAAGERLFRRGPAFRVGFHHSGFWAIRLCAHSLRTCPPSWQSRPSNSFRSQPSGAAPGQRHSSFSPVFPEDPPKQRFSSLWKLHKISVLFLTGSPCAALFSSLSGKTD